MHRMALLLMVVAWLLQGMMPALALPQAGHPQPSLMATMPHEGHATHPDQAAHPAVQAANAIDTDHDCPDCSHHSGKLACAMSLCAACTSLAPIVPVGDGLVAAFRYPVPPLAPALVAGKPAPPLPPPRA